MGRPITERELSSFIGTEVFSEADRIRKIPTTWGPENRDKQLADLLSKAENQLEITMQARGYFLIETIRKYEKSLEYHLKTRAGVTMPYQEICYLTADCNPDGTPIL